MCKPGGKEFRCANQYSNTCTERRNANRRAKYATSKGNEVRTYKRKDNIDQSSLQEMMGQTPPPSDLNPLTEKELTEKLGKTPPPLDLTHITQAELTGSLGELPEQVEIEIITQEELSRKLGKTPTSAPLIEDITQQELSEIMNPSKPSSEHNTVFNGSSDDLMSSNN